MARLRRNRPSGVMALDASSTHSPTSNRPRGLSIALRLIPGTWLVWCVGVAALAPELPWWGTLAAAGIAGLTIYRPAWGLIATTAIVPAAGLLAPAPMRAAEMLAWTFLASWLLGIWRPLSSRGWSPVTTLAALYLTVLVASWLSLTVSASAGVPVTALPQFLLQSIPRDYLILSAPEAETWTLLQAVTGVGMLLAAIGITRDEPRSVRPLALALTGSLIALAIATPIEVVRQWTATGYADWFLQRFLANGERFSIHLADVNAAGSLYVVACVIATAHIITTGRHRAWWIVALVLAVPALWLAGSRSAYLGILAGFGLLAIAGRRPVVLRGTVLIGAPLALALVVGVVMLTDPGVGGQGGVRESAGLRSQFLQTSARMFASSPVTGVGIGRYFERSAEYMTPELRSLYGNENAHNYFAQQFAELGVIGGFAFLWLVMAATIAGWRSLRGQSDAASLGLCAGACGYLLTCATGHPLLVPGAALPFWAVLGAVAGTGRDTRLGTTPRMLAIVVGLGLAAGVGRAAFTAARVMEAPAEHGFHQAETADDGTTFRWMTRHAVSYIPDGPGFLRLRLQAPTRPTPRAIVLETSIAGRVADRREIPAGAWATIDIPALSAGTPFRRVDFRVNHEWADEVRLGQRIAHRPIAIMTAEITWLPIR